MRHDKAKDSKGHFSQESAVRIVRWVSGTVRDGALMALAATVMEPELVCSNRQTGKTFVFIVTN